MTKDEVRADFGPFTDPATDLEIVATSDAFLVDMIRDGNPLRLQINATTGSVHVKGESVKLYASIESLFASEQFADLRQFAASQQRILGAGFDNREVIETKFEIEGKLISYGDAMQLIATPLTSYIRVIMIDGPAGIGKTHFLEALSLKHAKAFAQGEVLAPLLHVSSRGSRLSNLDSLIAKTTQLFRAKFSFDEVPVLVRRGLVLLAIDGFDELVDAEGYRDAWFSLREMLNEIGTSGTLILSGRDTFFDQQGFHDRLGSSQVNLEVFQLRIRTVEPEIAIEFLASCGWKQEDLRSSLTEDVLYRDSYALRPYFLKQLAEMGSWSSFLADASLRRQLVDRFIAREARLIMNQLPISEPDVRAGLQKIYSEVAMDMAERQADTVDIEYLSLLCEVSFENLLIPEDLRKLSHKAGSIGLLERDLGDKLRRFPHQEIFHYFLSHSFLGEIHEGRIPPALRRCVLGPDFLEVFNEEVQYEPAGVVLRFISQLSFVLEREMSSDRLANNGASLLITSLSKSLPEGTAVRLTNLQTTDACLLGSTPVATLSGIIIGRLDARGANLLGSTSKIA